MTHEEYYQIFAFLNESHEANVPVYSADEQMKRASIFREIAAIEAKLKERTADWREKMAAWEKVATSDPTDWLVVQPEVDDLSNGGQKYLPMPDGSFLAQGYAPTHHRVKMKVHVDVKSIAAFRLELLNDPELPLGGPGRSIHGTGALTEFEVNVAQSDHPEKVEKVKFARATASVNPPEKPLDPIFDDHSGKKRVTGPIAFAIDGKGETAWGIDIGPGRRNQPRKAVFVPEKPIECPKGANLTFYLKQDHGGWNSDDNQNNNLGRVRLSITNSRPPRPPTRPAGRSSDLGDPDRQTFAATSRDRVLLLANDRRRLEADENDQIDKLWREHPEGSSQLVLERARTPEERIDWSAAIFSSPRRLSKPAFLRS